jgi:hypothetical protein
MNHPSLNDPKNSLRPFSKSRRRVGTETEIDLRAAVTNPQVDAEKLRELLRYEERLSAQSARIEFDRAFSQLQLVLPAIAERGFLPSSNGGQGSTYARWEDINETVKPLLTKFGFAMRFRTAQTADRVSATCYLSHRGGHSEETTISLPLDSRDGKSGVHAVGSSTTYAKRYAASALLNITSLGDDDDGVLASAPPRIDPEQLAELRSKLSSVGGDEAHLSAFLGVETLAELPIGRFRYAIAILTAKGNRK